MLPIRSISASAVFYARDAAVLRNADKYLAAVRIGKGDDLFFETCIDLFL